MTDVMIFGSLAASARGSFSLAPGSLGGHRLVAARDEDPAFGADELDAVREVAADDHPHAVGVERLGLERTVHIPQALGRELRRAPDFDRARELGVHRPMRAVDVMRAPAGDHPGAELLAPQPARPVVARLRVDALLRVGHDRRRSEPHVVIERASEPA